MHTKLKRVAVIVTSIIMLVCALNMIDLPVELRFEKAQYNYLFVMVLCVALPLSIFVTSFLLKERWKTFLGVGLSLALVLPSLLTYYFASSGYEEIRDKGVDTSFEKITEVQVGHSTLRLYKTNGGATTSYGLVARKETRLLRGLNVVEVLFSKYKASQGAFKVVDEHSVELEIQPYTEEDNAEVVRLRI